MITEKEIEKLVDETKVKGEVHHYSNYLSTRFKEIQEEAEKLDWRDKNAYLAGCFKNLLETAIEQITAVNKNLEERRNEK